MTPAGQLRLGWLVLMATTGLGVLLQKTVQAFWLSHQRPASKAGGLVDEQMVLWPNVALLLLPIVIGVVLICLGFYRGAQPGRLPDEAA